jgi:hypothetical protein
MASAQAKDGHPSETKQDCILISVVAEAVIVQV